MDIAEFTVVGDAARAKATVVDALQARKFKLTWDGEWDAVAERGSKLANALAGALAQYFKVTVLIRTAPDGHGLIRVEKSSKGYMGGVGGAVRTNRNFDGLVNDLQSTFGAAGVLVNVQTT